MTHSIEDTIPDLLVANIRRDVVLGLEEAMNVGAQRGYAAAKGMNSGHLNSVLGQLRHFHMNESFHNTLSMGGLSPTPLCGNNIVICQSGIFTIARVNTKYRDWSSIRRSKIRKQMSLINEAIDQLVQPQLFSDYRRPSKAVVFIVSCFTDTLDVQPDTPFSIEISVPDRNLKNWVFQEEIGLFMHRHDHTQAANQEDLAMPKLKKSVRRDAANE